MPQALPLAVLYGLTLAGAAAGLFCLFCARRLVRLAGARAQETRSELREQIEPLRLTVDACVKELAEIRAEAPGAAEITARPGLNLNRRTQALRMSRGGGDPAQIASALQIPLQEVDLLLKVHRIFLGSLTEAERATARQTGENRPTSYQLSVGGET